MKHGRFGARKFNHFGEDMAQTLDESSPWRLNESEREAYASARETMAQAGLKKRSRASAPDKPISKAESAKLGKAMLQALVKRDQDLAMSLLESGAVVNVRDNAGESALEIALKQCGQGGDMHDLCEALIERGGFVSPGKYSSGASEFTEATNKGKPIQGNLLASCVGLTKAALMKNSARWSLIRDGMRKIAPMAADDKSLLSELGRMWRFGILRQAAAEGATLPKEALAAAAERLKWINRYSAKPTMFNSAEGKEFAALLKESSALSAFVGKPVAAFFNAAAWESDASALLALLDAGLSPGPNWMGSIEYEEPTSAYQSHILTADASLLTVASASPFGRGAFEALRSFGPALDAAKAQKPAPRVLALIPAQKLFELREAGVDIGSTDATGTFAHWWAKLDDKPRDGWAMLASKAPEIFEKPDGSGRRAADRMADKLAMGKDKDSFLGSLSRIESREIRKDTGAAPKKKAAAAAQGRGRL
jgi:hypothetical protein